MPGSVRRLGIALAVLAACAGSAVDEFRRARDEGRLDAAVAAAERARDANPRDARARLAVGWAYYFQARDAFDAQKDAEYAALVERSMSEIVEAMRLEPDWDEPHGAMGVVLLFQGKVAGAVTSFRNAHRLEPYDMRHYSNLAESLIFQGNLTQARRMLDHLRRNGAPPEVREKMMMLAAWRQKYLHEAGDIFANAMHFNEKNFRKDLAYIGEDLDLPPPEKPIQTFEDYADYCCANPICGDLMRLGCKLSRREVAEREMSREALLREMQTELERRRQIREIYSRRRELQIEVEDPEAPEEPSGAP